MEVTCRELILAGRVLACLAERREALFPASMSAEMCPSYDGRPSPPPPWGRFSRTPALARRRIGSRPVGGILRGEAEAILACEFLETVMLSGQRQHLLAVIEHATRRVRGLGPTAQPTTSWVAQVAQKLVMG